MTFPLQTARGDGPAPCLTLKIEHRIGEYRAMSGVLINLIIQIISGDGDCGAVKNRSAA
jgi:hypothetical protein